MTSPTCSRRTGPARLQSLRTVLLAGCLVGAGPATAFAQQLPRAATVTSSPAAELAKPLQVFESLLGSWEAEAPGFRSRLVYRSGTAGRVVNVSNLLFNASGEIVRLYEGSYLLDTGANAIRFVTASASGEIHQGDIEVQDGVWHVATVSGGSISGYRSVLRQVSADTMEYRALYRSGASKADVLHEAPLVYRRLAGRDG